RVDAGAVAEACELAFPRGDDALADARARLRRLAVRHLARVERRHVHVEVDAVEQRTGDPGRVALHLTRVAHAARLARAIEAARAGVHRGDEHEASRIHHGRASAADA